MKIVPTVTLVILSIAPTLCLQYSNLAKYLNNPVYESVLNAPNHANNDTKTCINDLKLLLNGVENKRTWALEMIDSWAKELPSGLLYGNNVNLGNFDECLSVNQAVDAWVDGHRRKRVISGQHCVVVYSVNDPRDNGTGTGSDWDGYDLMRNSSQIEISLGICVPDSCLPGVVYNLSKTVLKENNLTIRDYTQEDFCYDRDELKEWSLGVLDWITIGIISCLFLITAASTCYELWFLSKGRRGKHILVLFSIYNNSRILFTSKSFKCPNTLHCINGVRVLSLLWVILSHCYQSTLMNPMFNKDDIGTWIKSFPSLIILNSSLAVDSFFVLSGMLVCWVTMNKLHKGETLNVFGLYAHRYLRILPPFALLLLICSSSFKLFGSGPLWKSTSGTMVDHCQKYWWSALLFIQNYVNPSEICVNHSWFLSVDMQLFIIAPVLIYGLFKLGAKMILVTIGLIFVSMGLTFSASVSYGLRFSAVQDVLLNNLDLKSEKIYNPTHTRMGAWLVGNLLGYALFKTRQNPIRINRKTLALGWVLTIMTFGVIIFGTYPLHQLDYKGPISLDAFCESTFRVAWSVCLAWVIFTCIHGCGGIVNSFLCLEVWEPLGKLSYSAYLVHYPLQIILSATRRGPFYFSDLTVLQRFGGDVIISFGVALIWVLLLEMPVVGLDRMFFHRPKRVNFRIIETETENDEDKICP